LLYIGLIINSLLFLQSPLRLFFLLSSGEPWEIWNHRSKGNVWLIRNPNCWDWSYSYFSLLWLSLIAQTISVFAATYVTKLVSTPTSHMIASLLYKKKIYLILLNPKLAFWALFKFFPSYKVYKQFIIFIKFVIDFILHTSLTLMENHTTV
jgi:hypothetical protein